MFPEGTEAESIKREDALVVIQRIKDYLDQSRRTRTSVARDIGVSAPTLGMVLNELQYKGNWQLVILRLDAWLEQALKQDAAPKAGEFVWTSVARDIKAVADIAIKMRRIGVVYGKDTSGFGKTLTLKAIAACTPGAIYTCAEKMNASAAGIIRAIAHALNLQSYGSSTIVYNAIKAKLANTSRLIIVDQVHSLFSSKDDRALFTLCDLWDATQAPQIWAGTVDVLAHLDRKIARGAESLTQIRRRVVISRDLMDGKLTEDGDGGSSRGDPRFTVEDVVAVFKTNKIRLANDAIDYLYTLANLPNAGGLGTCSDIVHLATIGEEIRHTKLLTGEMLRNYHRSLVNGRAYTLLECRMETFHQRITKSA